MPAINSGLLAIATVVSGSLAVCALYVVLAANRGNQMSLFMNNVEQHRVQVNRLRPIVPAGSGTTWFALAALPRHFRLIHRLLLRVWRCCRPTSGVRARRARRCMPSSWRLSGPMLAAVARIYGRSSQWKPLDPYSLYWR